ncbi:MAG: hypothetical protein M0P04_11335, partial [Syntrophales bacterium]|nr:hypothetical protein [Syntrophales bacterium]
RATALAIVLLPEPAGPSMVTIMAFFCLQEWLSRPGRLPEALSETGYTPMRTDGRLPACLAQSQHS